jgi:hypothetical protein
VLRWLPFHKTCELERKFVPFTVRANAGLPATVLMGEREVIEGAGFGGGLMVKLSALEVPPPGAGFSTETPALPGELTSEARICAVSEVAET